MLQQIYSFATKMMGEHAELIIDRVYFKVYYLPKELRFTE